MSLLMDLHGERRSLELRQALDFIRSLPPVAAKDMHEDDTCPICFVPFSNILEEENAMKDRQEGNSALVGVMPGSYEEGRGDDVRDRRTETQCLGIVKLTRCGHMFCRRDLLEWVASAHGSCPACRNVFFDFTQESDYESSDGGEYIPGESEGDDIDFTDDGDWMPSSDRDTAEWEIRGTDADDTDTEYTDANDNDTENVAEGRNASPEATEQARNEHRLEFVNFLRPYLSNIMDRVEPESDEELYYSEDLGTVSNNGQYYSSGSTDVGLSDGSDTFSSETSYEDQIDEDEADAILDVNMLSMDELNNEDDPDYDPLEEDELMSDDTKTYYSGYSSGAEAEDEGSEP